MKTILILASVALCGSLLLERGSADERLAAPCPISPDRYPARYQ